jgi:pimeloyl-ACP methyl ester carboxylesterase
MNWIGRIWVGLVIVAFTQPSVVAAQDAFSSAAGRLVDVGGYKLRFNVAPGDVPVFLFESGGGTDSSYWGQVAEAIHAATHATVITYDRAGYGSSEQNPDEYAIHDAVTALETALDTLGFQKDVIVIAHSYGAFLAAILASRNEERLQGMVFVEGNLSPYFTQDQVEKIEQEIEPNLEALHACCPSLAQEFGAFGSTVETMRTVQISEEIPLLDIVAGNPSSRTPEENARYRQIHAEFTDASPERALVIAEGSGHNVMVDAPDFLAEEILSFARRLGARFEE